MALNIRENYAQLRATPVDEWDAWIGTHRFDTTPFHWWRALMESAEHDMRRQMQGPGGELGATLDFIADAVDYAVRSRAWSASHAAGTLCLYAEMLAERVRNPGFVPRQELTPDGAARRTVDSFTLSPDEAFDVAWRWEAATDEECSAVQEIRWALFFLLRLAPFISSPELADLLRAWGETAARMAELPW